MSSAPIQITRNHPTMAGVIHGPIRQVRRRARAAHILADGIDWVSDFLARRSLRLWRVR